MNNLRLLLIPLLLLGLLCSIGGEQKIDESMEGQNGGEKRTAGTTAATSASSTSSTEEVTTPNPSSACGGLKGFLHLCDTHIEEDLSQKPRNVPDTDSKKITEDSGEGNLKEEEKSEPVNDVKAEPLSKISTRKKRQLDDTNDSMSNESSDNTSGSAEPEESENDTNISTQ